MSDEVQDDYARGYLDGRLRTLDQMENLASTLGPLSSERVREWVKVERARLLHSAKVGNR